MGDERHGNAPNGITRGSPESPCLKTKTASGNDNSNSSSISTSTNHNKEQDRFLPIANVGRIMKKMIPNNGKISKDAKETVQECVSEFISFVTGEASDKCQREKRKTINGDDIIWAITTLGFEDYVEPLKSYLQKYREVEGERLNVPKQNRSEHKILQQDPSQHQHHQHHHQHPHPHPLPHPHDQDHNNLPLASVYSSTNLIPQQPCMAADQPFSLQFNPPSIQRHVQPQDHQIDSVGHW